MAPFAEENVMRTAREKIYDNACVIFGLANAIKNEQDSPTGDLDFSEEYLELIIKRCNIIQQIIEEE